MAASEMGYLIRFDPKTAKKRIMAALRDAGCHRGKAAEALACTHGTLIQWIKKLGMEEDVTKLDGRSFKEGWRDATAGQGGARDGAGRPRVKKKRAA